MNDILLAIASLRGSAIIDAIGPALDREMLRNGIDSAQRRAHFLAQVCHESDRFATATEYASGDAYEGRTDLGNTQPGDGRRFKGRGLIQLTGRANYRRFGPIVGFDLEQSPERAAEPETALRIACAFWSGSGLNALADLDDCRAITQVINGGQNGYPDRAALLARAKAALRRALHRGDKGPLVQSAQVRLRLSGRRVAMDGDFGFATESAIRAFQAAADIPASGVIDPATWVALDGYR